MIRIILLLISIGIASSQIIQRIHKNPADIFVIGDWKVYKAFTAINDVVESNSYIYFATSGAGILRYDKFKGQFIYPLTESNGLISNNIYGFFTSQADSGIVFKSRVAIQTDQGKQAFQLEQPDYFRFLDDAGNTFQAAVEPSKIKAVRGESNFFLDQPYDYIKPNEVSGPQFQRFKIKGKYTDSQGGVWLIVNNFGFFYSTTESGFFKPIRIGPISNSLRDLHIVGDDIWFAQHNNGNRAKPVLTKWTIDNEWTHFYEKYSMEINSPFYNVVKSHDDIIWFGGKFGLVSYHQKERDFREYRFKGLYDTPIYDLAGIGDTLLLATGKGLYYLSQKTQAISQLKYPEMGNVDIFAVEVNDEMIFVSSRFGLFKIDRQTMRLSDFREELNFPNFRTNVIEYIEDRFWFNNSDGLYSYDPKTEDVNQIHLSSTFFRIDIRAIDVFNNNIFLATDKGLLMYLDNDDEWVWITKREGLPSNQLTDVEIDGDFLILTSSEGVAEFLWNDPERAY